MEGYLTTVFGLPSAWVVDFHTAFTASLGMIFATEIGDRTFFIAAVMAMKYSRSIIFSGAWGALVLMTVISCVFGLAALAVIPKVYVHYVVVMIMFYFGGTMLKNGLEMENKEGFEELEEVEEEVKKKDEDHNADVEQGNTDNSSSVKWQSVFVDAFMLTFFAEWGDRSQLATIALSAAHSPLGVCLGGSLGHAICTGFAVIGGRMIAQYVTERTVTISGGVLFLIFALYALLVGPQE